MLKLDIKIFVKELSSVKSGALKLQSTELHMRMQQVKNENGCLILQIKLT